MGFKFKRIDLTAGSSEFPTGDSYALRRSRSEVLVTKIAQAIISSNCGWSLDTDKNLTDTSYVDIPSGTSGQPFPALFLVNNNGCRLFVSNFACYNSVGIVDFSGTGDSILKIRNDTNRYTSGVCMSMIPEGSHNVFGDPTSTSFLPSDATPIVGTVNSSTSTADYGSYAYKPQSGYTASWGIFVSPYVIAITAGRAYNGLSLLTEPVYAVGRIMGTLAHTNDTAVNSRYGVLSFRLNNNVYYEGTHDVIRSTNYAASTVSNKYFLGTIFAYNSIDVSAVATSSGTMGIISRADGTWINGTDGSTYGITIYPSDMYQTSPFILNSPLGDKSRWCPFAITSFSTYLDSYGVVPGDGFKGYLDPDLFRCAIGTYEQQFDNGNFICCSGNNFLIGWDPNNTDTLSGTSTSFT